MESRERFYFGSWFLMVCHCFLSTVPWLTLTAPNFVLLQSLPHAAGLERDDASFSKPFSGIAKWQQSTSSVAIYHCCASAVLAKRTLWSGKFLCSDLIWHPFSIVLLQYFRRRGNKAHASEQAYTREFIVSPDWRDDCVLLSARDLKRIQPLETCFV